MRFNRESIIFAPNTESPPFHFFDKSNPLHPPKCLILYFYNCFNILQGIPLAFVSTGCRPSTLLENMTLVESHNILKLNERDFHKISNNAYPVVFAYNGRDHFAPTIPCTAEQFTHWKVQSELGNLLAASLHVCAQLDQQTIPEPICSAVKDIQAAIARNLPTISKAGQAQFKELQKSTTHRGPAIQPYVAQTQAWQPNSLQQGNLWWEILLLNIITQAAHKDNS